MNLKKELGLFHAIAIVIGMVIGSGIFFKPSIVFGAAGSPMLGILAWIVGGIIAMAAGLTIAEIASIIPKVGGVYAYIKEIYGEKAAFLLGWVQTLLYYPGSIAALAIVFSTQAAFLMPLSSMQQKVIAISVVLALTISTIYSTKLSGRIQGISTVAKLIPIAILVFFGLYNAGSTEIIQSDMPAVTITGFGAAILGTLWAYDGWASATNMAGEMKNPSKNLPKAIILGLSSVVVVYVIINIAIISVMPFDKIIASETIASDVAVALFGQGGASFIAVGIIISIFGTLNGYVLTGPRVTYAMAEKNTVPFSDKLASLTKSGTPRNALILQCVLSCIYVMSGTFEILTNLAIFSMWVFFTMTVFGVFILRKRMKDVVRPYKVPLYPVIPIIGVVGGAYIVINTLFTDTMNALIGIGIALIGIPVYYYKQKRK
ncbi:MAG: amino acid permease [Clostridium sp.]|uniref:APC family permease n=1 Tax=Clostridium sp. TaxID=1506 RepID=UPI002FC88FE6